VIHTPVCFFFRDLGALNLRSVLKLSDVAALAALAVLGYICKDCVTEEAITKARDAFVGPRNPWDIINRVEHWADLSQPVIYKDWCSEDFMHMFIYLGPKGCGKTFRLRRLCTPDRWMGSTMVGRPFACIYVFFLF